MKLADNIQERPYQLFLNQIKYEASGKSEAEIATLANCMKNLGCNPMLPVVTPITDELYQVVTHPEVVEAAKAAGLAEIWVFVTTQQPSVIIEHCELLTNQSEPTDPTPDGSNIVQKTTRQAIDAALNALQKRYADKDFSDVSPAKYGSGWTSSRNARNANQKKTAEKVLMDVQLAYVNAAGKLSESYYDSFASCPIGYLSLLGKVESEKLGLHHTGYFFMSPTQKTAVQTAILGKIKSQAIIKKFDRELANAFAAGVTSLMEQVGQSVNQASPPNSSAAVQPTTQQPSVIIEHCELLTNPTPDGSSSEPIAKEVTPAPRKVITLKRLPSKANLVQKAIRGWNCKALTDDELAESILYNLAANLLQRHYSIRDKISTYRFKWNQPSISEAAKPELFSKMDAELKRRGVADRYEFDVNILELINRKLAKDAAKSIATKPTGDSTADDSDKLLDNQPDQQIDWHTIIDEIALSDFELSDSRGWGNLMTQDYETYELLIPMDLVYIVDINTFNGVSWKQRKALSKTINEAGRFSVLPVIKKGANGWEVVAHHEYFDAAMMCDYPGIWCEVLCEQGKKPDVPLCFEITREVENLCDSDWEAWTAEIELLANQIVEQSVQRKKTMVIDCGCTVHSAKKYRGYEWFVCAVCGKTICSSHLWKYVDENNGAITASSPCLCESCYSQKHPSDYHFKKMMSQDKRIENTHRCVRSLVTQEITADDANFTDSDYCFPAKVETAPQATTTAEEEWGKLLGDVLRASIVKFVEQEVLGNQPIKRDKRPTPPFELLQQKYPIKPHKQRRKKCVSVATASLFNLPQPTTAELIARERKQLKQLGDSLKPTGLFRSA